MVVENENLDETGSEKTEQPATETVEQTGVEEGTEVTETPAEKTVISDDDRKKFGIPEKFKYFEDVVKWGSEAEKAKSKAEQEKARYEQQLTEREEIIADFERSAKEQEQKGQITAEEREKMVSQFNEDWSIDPVGTMDKLFRAFERRLDEKQTRTVMEQKWRNEEDEIKKRYPDNWDSEVKPALAKIASNRPYLQSIEEALAIYELNKKKEELLNKTDSEKKKTEKKSAFSETGSGSGVVSSDIYDKIASAKTVEELEEITRRVPRTERT